MFFFNKVSNTKSYKNSQIIQFISLFTIFTFFFLFITLLFFISIFTSIPSFQSIYSLILISISFILSTILTYSPIHSPFLLLHLLILLSIPLNIYSQLLNSINPHSSFLYSHINIHTTYSIYYTSHSSIFKYFLNILPISYFLIIKSNLILHLDLINLNISSFILINYRFHLTL